MISVDAEISSPFARPNWITNGCIDDDEKVALHKLLHLTELLGLKWLVFFFSDLRAQKQIRGASGFSGGNPPILKSVCGVYRKTIWFLFMHINYNVFREKVYSACLCSNVWYQFGRVSSSPFFCRSFFIDFLTFYRSSSHFLRVFSMPVIFRQLRALMGLQQLNVGKRGASCSPPRFGAWRKCRVFMRSCPLFEW